MKEIEAILEPINGYLLNITRNPMKGWYELEIAIPKNWVFNQNEEIGIDVVSENEVGKLLKIFPKHDGVVVDDLILFVRIIITTNQKIAEKELQFKAQMEEMKKGLEQKASEFFKELDDLKEVSFQTLNEKFVNDFHGATDEQPRQKRKYTPRAPKIKTSGVTTTEATSTTTA